MPGDVIVLQSEYLTVNWLLYNKSNSNKEVVKESVCNLLHTGVLL
jgi:hypothetical protein